MKSARFTVPIELDDFQIGGVDVVIRFDRIIEVVHDPKYGADADGNRGIERTDIDDDGSPENVVLEFPDQRTAPVSDWSTDVQKAVAAKIDEYLTAKPPEEDLPEDDPYDGPDPDRLNDERRERALLERDDPQEWDA